MRNTPLKAFATPLKHDEDWKGNKLEEHAHAEDASRSSRQYITTSGKRGESKMPFEDISTGHSSTQGTYSELSEKARDAEIKKLTGK